jgi:hypothetical protein
VSDTATCSFLLLLLLSSACHAVRRYVSPGRWRVLLLLLDHDLSDGQAKLDQVVNTIRSSSCARVRSPSSNLLKEVSFSCCTNEALQSFVES